MARQIQNPEPAKYSAFARILLGIETEAKKRGYRHTRDFVANETHVVKSAVSAWFRGVQLPRPKHLEELANLFSLGAEDLRTTYRNRLFDAAGIPTDQGGARTAMNRARERIGIINIGISKYDAPLETFFANTLRAFAGFSAFYSEIKFIPFSEMLSKVDQGKIDIGANFFATPERAQKLRFIDTPITIGTNVLSFEKGLAAIPQDENGHLIITDKTVRPIVSEAAATGELFARYVLGFNSLDMTPCDYQANLFSDQLMNRFAQWLDSTADGTQTKHPVPIIIADEWMCLKIHLELITRMIAGRVLSSKWAFKDVGPAKLLLSSGSKKARFRRFDGLVGVHPTFNLSICVKRDERGREWFEYIQTAWEIFLRGSNEVVSDNYTILYKKLTEPLTALKINIATHPDRFAQHFQSLDSADMLLKTLVEDWQQHVLKWLRFDCPYVLPEPWNTIVSDSARDLKLKQSPAVKLTELLREAVLVGQSLQRDQD